MPSPRPNTDRLPGPWRPGPPPTGNLWAEKHGAYSPRRIAERAEQVHDDLLAAVPYLDVPAFLPSVKRYLDAAATESLLMDYVNKIVSEKGTGAVPSRTWEQLTASRRLAHKLAQDLGMTPTGHSRIMAMTAGTRAAASLQDLMAKGRALRIAQGDLVEADSDEDDEL